MMRLLFAVIALTVIYILALNSLDPWDILVGALVSTGLVLLFRRSPTNGQALPVRGLVRSLLRFIPFAGAVAWSVVVGTWQVALAVLDPSSRVQPGLVAVPIEDRTPLGIVVSALAATLSPGSVVLDIDREAGVMLFHVLDARDPDAFRRTQQDFYDRYQRHVFP
jgi:multisubunit Na+/H+ antiporter MnhE subunit